MPAYGSRDGVLDIGDNDQRMYRSLWRRAVIAALRGGQSTEAAIKAGEEVGRAYYTFWFRPGEEKPAPQAAE